MKVGIHITKLTYSTLALLLLTASGQHASAQGLDRVRDRNGITSGKITKTSALSVTLTKNGVATEKPVEEILSITFAGEPSDLSSARRFVDGGRYQRALEKLEKIESAQVSRTEVQQDIDFLMTYCKVQQALAGQGKLSEAKNLVSGFLSKNSKSYRVPAAIELLGNVLLASEDYEGARTQFVRLGKASAPYFKARSAVLRGHLLQAESKHEAAVEAFDSALTAARGNTIAQSQVLEATLHRAVSQSALGKTEEATKEVQQIIAKVDKEDMKLYAQAYNALGDCYLQSNQEKAAIDAFLHVDLLFHSAATEHSKALYQLSQLWQAVGKPARARDAEERLQSKYPGSRWARR